MDVRLQRSPKVTYDVAVDTSALVAIAYRERDAEWFIEQLVNAQTRYVSAGSLQEFLVVVTTVNQQTDTSLQETREFATRFLNGLNLTVEPVSAALALIGSAGVMRYRRAPARLNFGDGFAYALAKSRAIPLVCKGNDFPHTDIDVLQPDE